MPDPAPLEGLLVADARLEASTAPGLFVIDVSLDRARELRGSSDGVTSSMSFGAKQGVLGPQWQRPELREAMYPRK